MDDSARERLLALLRRHGWNATSFQTLEAGFRYWFDGDGGCVAYVETGRAWVAAGAPVAAPERIGDVIRGFGAAARNAGKRWAFFAAESRLVEAAQLSAMQIGEQPTWDPRRWADSLSRSKSLREQLRRARAKGVDVRRLTAAELVHGTPLRREIEALIDRWMHAKQMAPMGFLVDVQPFEFADERRYFVAERGGVVVGVAGIEGEWLQGFYVVPEWWGSGVANELHDAVVEHGARRLWCLEENHRARRFYEKRGWTLNGDSRVVEYPPHPLDVGYSRSD